MSVLTGVLAYSRSIEEVSDLPGGVFSTSQVHSADSTQLNVALHNVGLGALVRSPRARTDILLGPQWVGWQASRAMGNWTHVLFFSSKHKHAKKQASLSKSHQHDPTRFSTATATGIVHPCSGNFLDRRNFYL